MLRFVIARRRAVRGNLGSSSSCHFGRNEIAAALRVAMPAGAGSQRQERRDPIFGVDTMFTYAPCRTNIYAPVCHCEERCAVPGAP